MTAGPDGEAGEADGEPKVVVAPEVEEAVPRSAAGVFRRLDGDGSARIVLRQVSPTDFELVEGFRYEGRAGRWTVRPEDLRRTDLASIPRVLGWFAPSYGRHTLAALLHDHLVRNGALLDPQVPRHRADEVFRDALDELGVPYLRARIMWAAVTLATRWRSSAPARVALLVWGVAAAVGVGVLVWAGLAVRPVAFAAALLAPVPFAVLWGRREFKVGIVGGYTLWYIAMPAVVNFLAYLVYSAAELAVLGLRMIRPSEELPRPSGPPSYRRR